MDILHDIHDLMTRAQLAGDHKTVTVLAVLSEAIRDGWTDDLAELLREYHASRKETE